MIYNEGVNKKLQVQYEVADDIFFMNETDKRKIGIKHSILDFPQQDEIDIGNSHSHKYNKLINPHLMNQFLQKYMHFYRLISSFSLFSFIISLISVYGNLLNNDKAIYLNNALTIVLITLSVIKFNFHDKLFILLKNNINYIHIQNIIQILIIIPHPTRWTQSSNYFLHLLLTLRMLFPLQYLIYSSCFYDSRAYRVISVYGLSSTEHIFFAFKSVIRSLSIVKILFIQVVCIMVITHCLFLMSRDGEIMMTYLDCLQIVIVTIPTVGFGQYPLPYLGQKILIVIILIIGFILNSFIILTIINEMTMSQMEVNSYQLQKKIFARSQIQEISKRYIRITLQLLRANSLSQGQKRSLHLEFKNRYRQLKGVYTSIQFMDMDHIFSYFRTSLILLHRKTQQTQNMLKVLIKSLNQDCLKKENEKESSINSIRLSSDSIDYY